jgi:tetratricopeptide (TPR) repeat protein
MSNDDEDPLKETASENRTAPDDALLACRRAIGDDVANAENWERLGDLLLQRNGGGGSYEARQAYVRAYEFRPGLLTQWITLGTEAAETNGAHHASAEIDRLFTIGLGLNDLGYYDASLWVFEVLAVIEPTWAFPLTLCGMVLCNMQQNAEALPYLDRALALYPNDVGAWTMKTRALTALGLEDEAHAAHQRENAARRASGVARWMPREERPENRDLSHLN